ncbi:MAG TPA: VTT domain-containing protein [Hyphomonadaceae bacterium]|nr:VTT domain-containing protein [Hyphomonadaceae bacterium]
MNKFLAFLNNMDARAWRTVWVSLALLGGVGLIIVLGRTGILGMSDDVEPMLEGLREGPWGLPATIVLFTITSFVAAPQFALAAACVVAFGPALGFTYAMIGTVVSSWLHFYIGRFGGVKLVERYGGGTVNRLSRFIGRNDFVASTIVRNVPVAPAIVVNMAFGASHAKFWRFIAGVVVGSIPKIGIVALLGQSVLSAMGGGLILGLGIGVTVIGIWVTMAVMARRAVRGENEAAEQESAD